MTPGVPTVVVIDDAPEIRALVRTRLRLSRQFIVVADGGDGADAVALAERHQPALMLLDISMPHVDGLEALPRVLAASPRTRVVMYSGFDEEVLADRALALGAVAFVEKSTPIESLAERLRQIAGDDGEAGDHPGLPDEPGESPGDQQTLDEHLERFREVFDEAAIGMGTMTLSGTLVRANRALAALVGRTTAELVGAAYGDIVAGGSDGLGAALAGIAAGEQDVVQVEHGVAGGAADVQVRSTLAAVRGSDGRPLYVFLQVQDVSEQRAAEAELRRSEQRFRLLVEAVQDYAIFMLDPQGHIASWNIGAQRAKGYRESEIVGQHFRVFYPPEKQQERHPERELEVALREGRYEEEGWRVRKDGSRFWANVVITALFDDTGTHVGFGKVTRDITERRHMLEQLEHVNAQLREARDDQAQFLAVTAHELRMPIGVLGGSADTLSKHWGDLEESERAEMLTAMATSAARLRRLLSDLLTASRLDDNAVELSRQRVAVAELLAAAAANARRADPGAQVVVDAPADLAVEADADRLAQAVDNLLSNGLRHGRGAVRLSATGTAEHVTIRVRDAGAGVPLEMQDRLFERFVTGAARGGTGLGLFIVRALARMHGGDTVYEPPTEEEPSGAFVVTLPRAP